MLRTHAPPPVLLATALLAALLSARQAHASETFPAQVRDELALSYTPVCALCHDGGVTGIGTVTTPFGAAMRLRGLVQRDEASLTAALAHMTADAVDSDVDGALDIDELRAGTDPNVSGTAPIEVDEAVDPMYGCRGEIAPRRPGSSGLVPCVLVALAAAFAARRRKGCR